MQLSQLRIIVVAIALIVLTIAPIQPAFPVCGSPSTLPIQPGGVWTTGAPMPTPRSEIAATVLDGKIYVVGGLFSRALGIYTAAFEAYDIATDTWAQLAPVPAFLHHTAIAAWDGKLYVIGGYHTLAFDEFSEGWAYDPNLDSWSSIADLPEARGAHQLLTFDDHLWVIGGTGVRSDELWAYDPATDTWQTDFAPLSVARNHLAAVVGDDNLFYVIAGRTDDGSIGLVERYNPADDTWETLPVLPTVRSGVTAALVDGRIHFTGGENLDGNLCTYNQHEVFDIESETWSAFEPLPVPRHGLASVAYEGKWYVIGGATSANEGTFGTVTGRVDIFTPTDSGDG
ncbi:MAG: kelch repeat-containing protein [Chloroflexi bacterium]|nr:MAG: kelch repeat-containing protein [Chloroflexota bacterium]